MTQVESGDLDPKRGVLFGEAERGGEVIFTREGRPVAKLIAFPPPHDPDVARRALDDLSALRDEPRTRGVAVTQDEIRTLRAEDRT